MIILGDGALLALEAGYAIGRYDGENSVVAVRAERKIRWAEFQRDASALAGRLPDHKYILNMCVDRYRFMVGYAAALQRRQISLLPASDAPGVLKTLVADYPDLYALTDTACPLLPSLVYPDDLDIGGATPSNLAVPEEQQALIFFTSGSTGQPKPVPKCWGPLVRSARAAGRRFGISQFQGATIIGTVPHQHSYGFESMVLLALQHGLTIDTGWHLYPADIRAALERAPRPRILVTTPLHIRALLAEPEFMPQADLILSATAPLAVSLARQAEACFGAPLIEIYGCTEAGQVATRRTAHDMHWECLDGVDFSQGSQGTLAGGGLAGGTWASGASVQGTALLQDVIEMVRPGIFRLGGRATDLVNVAGKRASLAYLNHQLLSIAGVQDGVFLMRETDGHLAARLMAVVVAPGLRSETILQALRELIDPAFLPRPLIFASELPRNALGKLPREALLQLAGQGHKP